MATIIFKICLLWFALTVLAFIFFKLVSLGESPADKIRMALGTYKPKYWTLVAVMVILCFPCAFYMLVYLLFLR